MDEINSTYLDFTKTKDFDRILTNPILDIAARFWEKERYEAFRICYRSMRIIDDLIDDRKATGEKIITEEKEQLTKLIENWLKHLKEKHPIDEFQEELLITLNKFQIPQWPWIKLAKAMIYDLNHDGFKSFLIFLRYSEGAAISPASVFMHLCGVQNNNGNYSPPSFDIRLAARPLALFSYLVHIIRDFEKDHRNNLNYFANDILNNYNLTQNNLFNIATGGEISENFRKLTALYKRFALYYRNKAEKKLKVIMPQLDDRYKLSLDIIYNLYNQIFERIEPVNGFFTTEALNPTPADIKYKIDNVIKNNQNSA
jgi:phytoene/squalene synthetase